MLPLSEKRFYSVSIQDIETFVEAEWGIKANIVEWYIETPMPIILWGVSDEPLSEVSQKLMTRFKELGSLNNFILRNVLQDFCNKGYIPAGDYIIKR